MTDEELKQAAIASVNKFLRWALYKLDDVIESPEGISDDEYDTFWDFVTSIEVVINE